MLPGRSYLLKLGTQAVTASIQAPKYQVNVDTAEHLAAKTLALNAIRRVGEVARLMTDAGLIIITAFISPFRAEREMVRRMMAPGEFIEVHIDTPLAVAEERDVKGLYRKARAGELKNFTGIDSPYEAPEDAEIHIDTTAMTPEQAADLIIEQILR